MDKRLEVYLEKVNKYLKGMTIDEREDIIKEIRSTMVDMQDDDLVVDQILERLGDPKDMAKAYLGDMITKTEGLSFKKVMMMIGYYSIVGISGMMIIPVLGIMSPTLILSGAVCIIAGFLKVIGEALGDDMSFIMVNIAGNSFSPFMTLIICIMCGIAFIIIGVIMWKGLKYYIEKVSVGKKYIKA